MFSCRQLIKREKKTEMEKANELPNFYPHNLIPSPSVTGKAVDQPSQAMIPELHSEVFKNISVE